MSDLERGKDWSARMLSWDYLPEPKNPGFSVTAPFQLGMLVKVSEKMRNDPDRSIFRAVSALSNVLYSDITSQGLKFSQVSTPVTDYIEEYPKVVDYILKLIEDQSINMKGRLLKNKEEVPTFNSFIKQEGRNKP